MRVGFIGLGDQGAPMAQAIAGAGFELFVWARRPESLQAVAGLPHTVCETAAEVGERAEVLGLCLRDDNDIEHIAFGDGGLLASMKPGSVLANHGTGSPDVCREWADRAQQAGVHMLDAPVSGGRAGAEARTLTTMIGGDAEAAERCRPVFDTFSRLITYLGPPGSGQLAKLVNNTLLASNLKNVEEMLVLTDELGFDRRGLVEVLMASSASSFALEALTKYMNPDNAEHYTKMVGKDVGHFSSAARARGVSESPVEGSARAGVAGIAEFVDRWQTS